MELPTHVTACRACSRGVRWAVTEAGARILVDADPHPDGVVTVVSTPAGVRARILTGAQLPAQETAYQPHARTCPHAVRQAPRGPRCERCRGPMPTDLARLERWRWHPNCDPREQAGLDLARRLRRTPR